MIRAPLTVSGPSRVLIPSIGHSSWLQTVAIYQQRRTKPPALAALPRVSQRLRGLCITPCQESVARCAFCPTRPSAELRQVRPASHQRLPLPFPALRLPCDPLAAPLALRLLPLPHRRRRRQSRWRRRRARRLPLGKRTGCSASCELNSVLDRGLGIHNGRREPTAHAASRWALPRSPLFPGLLCDGR